MESPILQFVPVASCAATGHHWEKPGSIFFVPARSHTFKLPQALFLQAEQTRLSAFLTGQMLQFQSPTAPCELPPVTLPLPDWEPPGTDAARQESATTTGQGMDSTPGPDGSALPIAAQGTVGLFCHEVTQTLLIQNLFGCFLLSSLEQSAGIMNLYWCK